MMEEAPRDFATLAADALDVTERVGDCVRRISERYPAPVHASDGSDLAWQVQRLARQVAELAQRLDGDTSELFTHCKRCGAVLTQDFGSDVCGDCYDAPWFTVEVAEWDDDGNGRVTVVMSDAAQVGLIYRHGCLTDVLRWDADGEAVTLAEP